MDKIENPYQVMLERLRVLDQSIHVLNQVNKDLRQILHKQYIQLKHCFFSFSNL